MAGSAARVAWVAACAWALAADPAPGGDAAADALPFPVEKTAILHDEKAVYFVEGRRRIPKGVEVTVLRGVRVLGRGKDATIEVEGGLKVHGMQEREVTFEGVTVEPQAAFDAVRIDLTVFRKGGGVRSPATTPCAGYFMLELLDLVDGAAIDLALSDGSVELSSVCSDAPVRLRAIDRVGSRGNSVKVEVRNCAQDSRLKCQPHGARAGLVGGLVVEGANDVVVRLSRLGGALTAVRDWRHGLIFDGNKVGSKRLELTQPVAGRFARAQLVKCDVYSEKVLFLAPVVKPGVTEEAYFERWWFAMAGGSRDAVLGVVEDADDAPATNAARAKVGKLSERALELAGPLDR